MSHKSNKSKEELKVLRDIHLVARKKVLLIRPHDVIGNVVCCLDQDAYNIDLCNLAIMTRTNHSRLQALLRHYRIPRGKESKKFAVWLRSEGLLEMIHPIKKKLSLLDGKAKHHVIKHHVIEGFTFD